MDAAGESTFETPAASTNSPAVKNDSGDAGKSVDAGNTQTTQSHEIENGKLTRLDSKPAEDFASEPQDFISTATANGSKRLRRPSEF